ncbi:MAG: gliding motility protein GldM [Edaphocola sp.]
MSLPKEPRQQMINMMYLVLTAMLAMNITKEVLTAFGTINGSIEKTTSTLVGKNDEFYKSFDEAQSSRDGAKVKPFNDKAKLIKAKSEELYAYLSSWKDTIIARTGGMEEEHGVKAMKGMDDINVPTLLFVEQKKGDEVRKKIEDFKGFVLSQIDNKADRDRFANSFPIQFPAMAKSDDNPSGEWAFGTFHNIPAIAAVAMFSKYQNDVKNTESMVLDYLASQVYLKDDKFDKLVAIATPNTTYALEGQEINATIVLGAYNSTANPTITSNAGTVPVKDGVGTLKIRASGAGVRTVNGTVSIVSNGETKSFPYKFEYTVGSAGASLQLDKMNVMYIGVANPISLSASGYNIEDVRLNMPWAKLESNSLGKGHYDAWVTTPGVSEYTITAARGSGSAAQVGAGKIKVKRIPDPVAYVAGKTEGLIQTSIAKAQAGVIAKADASFEFEARFKVTSFRFVFLPKAGDAVPVMVNGASFNQDAQQLIARSKPGDRWVFDQIKAVGPDNFTRSLNSIILTLN